MSQKHNNVKLKDALINLQGWCLWVATGIHVQCEGITRSVEQSCETAVMIRPDGSMRLMVTYLLENDVAVDAWDAPKKKVCSCDVGEFSNVEELKAKYPDLLEVTGRHAHTF